MIGVGGSVATGRAVVIKFLWELCRWEFSYGGVGVIKWVWELCRWECIYRWVCCEQKFMGAVLVGV